ncbi:MAG: SCP2 sterol-binding domain-containing protein, partial [Myxococcota bacterium]
LDQFPNLRRECDTSILGFLGVMAGLEAEMKLTSQRVRSLRALQGSLRFEIEGPDGFVLVASFGVDPPEPEPRTEIRLSSEIFEALRGGVLDAQEAFLDERIAVIGDLELAIGMALAAASPD